MVKTTATNLDEDAVAAMYRDDTSKSAMVLVLAVPFVTIEWCREVFKKGSRYARLVQDLCFFCSPKPVTVLTYCIHVYAVRRECHCRVS